VALDIPIAQWNGRQWAVKPAANPVYGGGFEAVSCPSANVCFAVGFQSTSLVFESGHDAPLAERWDGKRWTIESTPLPPDAGEASLESISCATAASCVATGVSDGSSGQIPGFVEQWNGTTWRLDANPSSWSQADQLADVSCTSATTCMTVGQDDVGYHDDESTAFAPLSEQWNGGVWRVRSVPDPKPGGLLSAVSCARATACTAVGEIYSPAAYTSYGIVAEGWNGRKWSLESAPAQKGGSLNSVSCISTTTCMAVGSVDQQHTLSDLESPPPHHKKRKIHVRS
jgi:hypothetical protein